MSDEEEKKSLLPAQQQSSCAAYGSVPQQECEDQEGGQGDGEEADARPCWVYRHKILTAVVIFTAWTCIGITIFLVLFLKVIRQWLLLPRVGLENINREYLQNKPGSSSQGNIV